MLDKATLTVIMKSNDIDRNPAPSGDWEHHRLTGFVSNDQRGVLDTVLRNGADLDHHRRSSKGTLEPARLELNIRLETSSRFRIERCADESLATGLDTASRYVRCDSIKSRNIFINLWTGSGLVS